MTCSGDTDGKGQSWIVTQFYFLHRGRLFQLPSSGGSSELPSLAAVSRPRNATGEWLTLGSAPQVAFIIGVHDNPMRRLEAPFSS